MDSLFDFNDESATEVANEGEDFFSQGTGEEEGGDECLELALANPKDADTAKKEKFTTGRRRRMAEEGGAVKNRKRVKRSCRTYRLGLTKKGHIRKHAKPYRIVKGSLWDKICANARNAGAPLPEGLPKVPEKDSVYANGRKAQYPETPLASDTVFQTQGQSSLAITNGEDDPFGSLGLSMAEDGHEGFGLESESGTFTEDLMNSNTSTVDALFEANIGGIFGDPTDMSPGDFSSFGGTLSDAILGRDNSLATRSQFDMILTQTTVEDHDFGSQLPAYAQAYKYTPKIKYSSTDERAFYDALRFCGTDLFLVHAHLRGWTYEQVKRKFSLELKRNPKLLKEILHNPIPFSTRPWQETSGKSIDPRTHYRPEKDPQLRQGSCLF